jgi:dipeptidyl aminopeptidase/acylaminoacyl peptidase
VASNVDVLRLFARAGYAAMDVEYRRTTSGSIDLQDIFASFDFLNRAPNVKRGVIAINRFSLRARMALQVAAHRDARAVSAIAARTSSSMDTPTVLEEAARLRAPILLQHGVDDSVVPYNDSVLLERKLKGLGRTVALISYPGAGHNGLPWEQVYSRVLAFFAEHVR